MLPFKQNLVGVIPVLVEPFLNPDSSIPARFIGLPANFRCETRCEPPPAGVKAVPATFRTKHHRNSAPRYMRWIPESLQPLFNGKTRLTKQLKPMDEREVARAVRA